MFNVTLTRTPSAGSDATLAAIKALDPELDELDELASEAKRLGYTNPESWWPYLRKADKVRAEFARLGAVVEVK